MTTHRHSAQALVIGVDGPLRVLAERSHVSQAVLIAPGFAHAVDAGGGRLAMFVLPVHAWRRGDRPPVQDLSNSGRWVELGEAMFQGHLADHAEVDRVLSLERLQARPIDPRLRTALNLLTATLETNVSVEQIASAAHLSASRLMALAHEQLGTPLRACRRWLRTFHVARRYAQGDSLTEAAIAAGFSSSAHLSAATREHFGIRPSDVLSAKNRSAIHAI